MIPEWAEDLVTKICADNDRREPDVIWKTRRGSMSSGSYYDAKKEIILRAGTELMDQKGCLIHELCHHLCPAGWHHNKRFYVRCFDLYRKYGGETLWEYEGEREGWYMLRSREVSGWQPARNGDGPAGLQELFRLT